MSRLLRLFHKHLTDTIHVRSLEGRDEYNQPIFSAPVAYRARVDLSIVREYERDGNMQTDSAHVVVDSPTPIAPDSHITLPDGSTPRIKESNCITGLHGLKLCQLVLGK